MAERSLDYQPSPGAFQPLMTEQRAQVLSRPSLSYWQDAWIRLRANRRAIVSLYIVLGLLVFTVLGPQIWRVDPSEQDLDQISTPPGFPQTATLTEPWRPWDGTSGEPAGSGLALAAPATTQSVRLTWDPMPGASAYRVYRNIFSATPGGALGLPLTETYTADERAFEDRLDLRPRTYYYAVVGLDEAGNVLPARQSLEVDVERVITIEVARELGLIAAGDDVQVGDHVTLAWHPLGTDYLGRDMLSRLMYGARVSLFIGIFAPLAFVLFGTVYGSAAGFVGGRFDQFLMRFADFIIALPFLLFMILFKVVFNVGAGESGILPMMLAMVLLLWPATARLVRGQILQVREEGYVSAARLLGARTNYLVLRHMIPNTLGVILVTLTFAVPNAIFIEAFLSFIGMGVAPPTPSWGSMCNEGIKTMLTYPHELILPALLISITVLAFNLLGDGLRDALDAKMRSKE